MKKRIASVIASCLVLSLLMTACGSADTKESSSKETQQSSAPSAASSSATKQSESKEPASSSEAPKEPVVLTVLVTDEKDMDKNFMTKRIEEMFNVDLQFQTFPYAEGLATRFNLLLASEDLPDIILGGKLEPEQIIAGVEAEALLPLNDYIVEGTNYKLALEENPEWIDYLALENGNIYTFMETDSGKHMLAQNKMFYRADWMEKLGWTTPPTTPEELKEYLIDIRDNDVNGNGDPNDEIPLAGHPNTDNQTPIFYLMSAFGLATSGYVHITDNDEIVFEAAEDYWRKGLAYMADLFKEGLIAEETFVWDKASLKALADKVGEEAVLGMFPNFWQGSLIGNKEGQPGWTAYQPLAPLKGDFQGTSALLGDSQFKLMGAISADCEHPEVAFSVLDWMLSEEAAVQMLFGVEGRNWEWIDGASYLGTSPSRKSGLKVPEDDAQADWGSAWATGRTPWYDRAEIRYGKYYDKENDTGNTTILLAGAQVYEPYHVSNNLPQVIWADEETILERAEYSALINDYVKTACAEFILGIRDINDDKQWEAYLNELDAMGLDRYIEVLYKYYGLK